MLPAGRTPSEHVAGAPVHLALLDSEVRIPPVLDEAVRDICRARTDATDDLVCSKQRLNAFLLRNGFSYTGKSKWTVAHMRYLRELTMPSEAQRIVL